MNAVLGSRASLAAQLAAALRVPAVGTAVAALMVVLVGAIFSPGFASGGQLARQASVAAILAIVAAGQGFVVLAGKEGIDMSVGSVMSLAALLAGNAMHGSDAPLALALAIALGVGAAVGIFNGLGVIYLRVPPLVMTLGTAGVLGGLLVLLTRGQTSGSAAPILGAFVSRPGLGGLPGIVWVWLVLLLLIHLLLRNTRFGFNLYATGANETAARLSGVRIARTRIAAYGLGGMFAGLGGFLLLGYTGAVFVSAGEQYVLPSVIAVVIGGTSLAGGRGNFFGTSAGAIFLTLLTALLTTLNIGSAQRQVVFGLTLIGFLVLYGRARPLR